MHFLYSSLLKQSNIIDNRLGPLPVSNSQSLLPIFIVEQNLVGISAVMLVVFYRRLGIHMTRHVKTLRHPQNRQYITYRTCTTPPEEDRATAICNMHKNWWSQQQCFAAIFAHCHFNFLRRFTTLTIHISLAFTRETVLRPTFLNKSSPTVISFPSPWLAQRIPDFLSFLLNIFVFTF